jgi:hypothetical protein
MSASTFGSRIFRFYTDLVPPRAPRGIHVMNPYALARVREYVRAFLGKYFADNAERVLVLGINPGRFGAGVTGVTFTDPAALADICGIANDLPRRREPSSIFVYDFIDAFGGPRDFYRRFFLTAVCPLGFTRKGVNYNYYDDRRLQRAVIPFIVDAIGKQIAAGGRRDHAIVLGKGKNLRLVEDLNAQHGFFQEIHGLTHPRPIAQYGRRRYREYLNDYLEVFSRTLTVAHRTSVD